VLSELRIENFAVIERIEVCFHGGLNLLTGETGSGKSIVVDALDLLLGGRTSAEMVRTGAERARLSGLFAIPKDPELNVLLSESGIEPEDGELWLEREILANGKSRAFVSGRPVTAAFLRQLGRFLADIHGQNDQQMLFEPEAQREILDQFAEAAELLDQVRRAWRQWDACRRQLSELEQREKEKLKLADLWTFQQREIEQAAPKPGEDAVLEAERRRLQNVSRLRELAVAAYDALYESPESVLAGLRAAGRRLEELSRLDPSFAEPSQTLEPARYAVEEVALALRDYLSGLEADPGRLEEIESRLAVLDKLKRKYGPSLEEVLLYLERLREDLAALESYEERQATLLRSLQELEQAYDEAARRLSELRRRAAGRLAQQVEEELRALAMEKTVFEVELIEGERSENGLEQVRFLVSPNPGETPRPLEKVASGGELSRIALALKTCASGAAVADPPRTLVFDEVDAGIGGRAAEVVGRRLKQLAASHQVLCVTHLPQIAGFADHHYFVEKQMTGRRTAASIRKLKAAERVHEIGRMLSGEKVTPEALRHAESLIRICAAQETSLSKLD